MEKIVDYYNPADTFNNFFDNFSKSIAQSIQKISTDNNFNTLLLELLQKNNNKFYIKKILLTSFIKDKLPPLIKQITIAEDVKDLKKLSNLISKNIPYSEEIFEKITIFIDCIYAIFMNEKVKVIEKNIDEPDLEIKQLMSGEKLQSEATKEQIDALKNMIIQKLNKKEFQLPFVKDEIGIYILKFYAYCHKDINIVRELSQSLGILDHEHLLEILRYLKENGYSIAPEISDAIHDLLDKRQLLEKYEDGTISKIEKQMLKPKDFVYKFLQQYHSNEEINPNLLQNVKVISLIDMFKKNELKFEDLCILLEDPKSSLSQYNSKEKERLKSEIKKTVMFHSEEEAIEYNNKFVSFSGKECLKLTKLGLLSDEDMILVYVKMQLFENQNINNSEKLFEDKNRFSISEEEIKEYYTPQKLVNIYFKKQKYEPKMFEFIINFCISINSKDELEEQILSDTRISSEDIIYFYEMGVIKHSTLKALKSENENFRLDFFEHIKNIKDISEIAYYINSEIVTEDDLIEIFDDDYEQLIRDIFRKRLILADEISCFTFLDNKIVMEEYHKSIDAHLQHPESPNEELDFESMFDLYLINEELVKFDDIYGIVKEKKEEVLNEENFNLSKYLCSIILGDAKQIEETKVFDIKILIPRIRELYMNSFLNYDELNELAEKGVIEFSQAKKINEEFCSSEYIKKLKDIKLGDSDSLLPSTKESQKKPMSKNPNNAKKSPSEQQILQAKAMIQFMESLSFSPITSTNQYGISKIETFSSGDFKDYRVFVSEEIPNVVALVHIKQVPNTDIYYHVGDNATYIMSTASFNNYLCTTGKIQGALASFNTTKSNAKESKYTRRANVAKTWVRTVPRKIGEIMNMLEDPNLQEIKPDRFEISSILSEYLSPEEKKRRLEIIEECKNDFLEAKSINDDK